MPLKSITGVLDAEDAALLEAVRGLRWPARRLVPDGLIGDHASRGRGRAAEFAEYRAYRPGDEPGRLDWRLLARSDRAYIRLSQGYAVLPTVLVLDASASLAYPERTHRKWHHARRITLGLAWAAHRGADPVGLMVATASGTVRFPPSTRRSTLHDIARTLAGIEPAGDSALAPLLAMNRGSGRLVIISDFLGGPDQGESDALLRVAGWFSAAGREIYAVHIIDEVELDPPRTTALVYDPERPALRRPLTGRTRERYLAAFAEWRAQLARRWREAGAVYIETVTSESAVDAVRRITASGSAAVADGAVAMGAR